MNFVLIRKMLEYIVGRGVSGDDFSAAGISFLECYEMLFDDSGLGDRLDSLVRPLRLKFIALDNAMKPCLEQRVIRRGPDFQRIFDSAKSILDEDWMFLSFEAGDTD